MAEIHILDSITVGQIAAGEIIERPLSIVKELVENAVDAGAERVTVNIERGGTDLIEVIDDGAGIDPNQLPLAVRRHATSKLAAAEDLESIATLGFRGEGLASIAAVAHVTIVSKARAENSNGRPENSKDVGAKITAHADTVSAIEPAAAPTGTRVRAERLFENVPVRREYLRTASAEFNRISSWLSTFALAYPQVTFTLRHDGKDVWTMPSTDDMRQRLAMVFGKNATEALMPLESEAASTLTGSLRGFISLPGSDRPDRRMQVLFVNGRLLRSTLLAGAWTAGYSTFAMIGRHPFGVLFLDIPPEHVDPNVHPTKSDVRLRYSVQVFDAVRRSIAATLHAHATQRFHDNVTPTRAVESTNPPVSLFAPIEKRWPSHEAQLSPASGESYREESERVSTDSLGVATQPHQSAGPPLRVVSQVYNTYILVTDGTSVLLFDQHAAHERIAYEQIVHRANKTATTEPLLVPIVVELDAGASEALDRTIDLLREGGLEIEPFGERTYRIVATPAGYGARAFDIRGFLDDLSADPKQRDVRERIWASLACHSVTVAGEKLEFEEMQTLVERLQHCQNPMHCPHGRPTLVTFSPDDLARLFKRM